MKASPAPAQAKFLHGSTMRHILVMTSATSVGLLAIFAVEFINIFYLNRLGRVEIAAAAGYAATLFFFLVSLGIGLSIAATALVAPTLGAGDLHGARRLTRNIHIFAFALTFAISAAAWPLVGKLLGLLGAEGPAKDLAASYLRIALPSTPFLTSGMVSAAVLRSAGDARRSMWVTLTGAIVTAILDPIFIFGFGLGIEGAAIASSISRFAIMLAGLRGVVRVHHLIRPEDAGNFRSDVSAMARIAAPAILTNLATPFANAYVTSVMAAFGDGAVAGWTIIGRLLPISFVGLFALTGAVGPILGQNLGARFFDRVRGVYTDGLIFTGFYTLFVWAALALAHPEIAAIMKAKGQAADLIALFCTWLAPFFAFMGALFLSNAAFNNLGRPEFAAFLNWARAIIGTAPFVMLGAQIGGAKGALIGQMAGSAAFGVIAVYLCYRYISHLALVYEGPVAGAPLRRGVRWWYWPSSRPRF